MDIIKLICSPSQIHLTICFVQIIHSLNEIQNKMKSFDFKAYDTFVGFQLSVSSIIYPNTHWLNQK